MIVKHAHPKPSLGLIRRSANELVRYIRLRITDRIMDYCRPWWLGNLEHAAMTEIKDPIILIVPRDVRLHQIAEFAANVGCSLRLGDTGQIRLVKNADAKAGEATRRRHNIGTQSTDL